MAVPIIVQTKKGVVPTPRCSSCNYRLQFKMWRGEHGLPLINTKVIVENFCPKCGEPVDGFRDEEE